MLKVFWCPSAMGSISFLVRTVLNCHAASDDLINQRMAHRYPIDLAERGTALLLSAQDILRKALTASTATAAAAASTGAAGQAPAADTELRPHVQLLNMRDASQAENQTPLSRHCQCFGCQRHTAAYMHHLTMTHEMLGDSLLTEHNLWQMHELFSCARQAIAVGAWPHFVAAFAEAMAPPPEETL